MLKREMPGIGRGAAWQADPDPGLDQAGIHPIDRHPAIRAARPASGNRHRLLGPCPDVAELGVSVARRHHPGPQS